MTSRKDILTALMNYAKQNDLEFRIVEGGNHTRVWVGDRYTTIPRHREIPNNFARKILKQAGVEK